MIVEPPHCLLNFHFLSQCCMFFLFKKLSHLTASATKYEHFQLRSENSFEPHHQSFEESLLLTPIHPKTILTRPPLLLRSLFLTKVKNFIITGLLVKGVYLTLLSDSYKGSFLIPQSHYRQYILWLEVLLGGRTTLSGHIQCKSRCKLT